MSPQITPGHLAAAIVTPVVVVAAVLAVVIYVFTYKRFKAGYTLLGKVGQQGLVTISEQWQ